MHTCHMRKAELGMLDTAATCLWVERKAADTAVLDVGVWAVDRGVDGIEIGARWGVNAVVHTVCSEHACETGVVVLVTLVGSADALLG